MVHEGLFGYCQYSLNINQCLSFLVPGSREEESGMLCPYCNENDDRVVNSRTSVNGSAVKRRRECLNCGRRYTTYERIEDTAIRIVKKDGSRENFSRSKLLEGLNRACHKRPVSADVLEETAEEVEQQLTRHYENEVPSNVVGEMVMERLKELDHVAFIRFASVYREFKDIRDFLEQADIILGEKGEK